MKDEDILKDGVIVKEFEHRGYRCIVTFNNIGAHCGYVELPPGHRLGRHDIAHYSISDILHVHGGISYSAAHMPLADPRERGGWFIGFDCAHSWDGRDFKKAFELGLIGREYSEMMTRQHIYLEKHGATFKDVDYVEAELRKLADQIAEKGGAA